MLTSVKAVITLFAVEAVFGAFIVGIVALMSTFVAGWVAVVFGGLIVLQLMGIALSGLLAKAAARRVGSMMDEMNKEFGTKF